MSLVILKTGRRDESRYCRWWNIPKLDKSYYLSNVKNGDEIVNISSDEIPIIGVGEGTTGRFVHEFSKGQYGLNITELMYKI